MAGGLPLAAFAVELAFRSMFEEVPFALFFLAVALSAWVGGLAPGGVAVVLSAALGWAYLRGSEVGVHAANAERALAVFLPVASVIAAIGAAARAGFRERERVARTLRESEALARARAEEMEAILAAVPAIVLIAHDPEARTMTGSRVALDLLRLAPGSNPSKSGVQPPAHFRLLKDGCEVGPADLPTQAAARTGRPARNVELEVAFDDGTRRRLLGNAEPLFDEKGRSRGAVSAFVDVTKLSDALRARDAFLSIASHELKTPLTTLQLHAESLQRGTEGASGAVAKAATAIRRQVVRLTALVNALLDVSRLNEGRLQFRFERIDLAALVRDVASRFAADAETSGSRIELEVAEAVLGRWDRLRVEQVVTNLLSNALKFGQGKPISVRVESHEGTARVVVADKGIGIAPEEQRRIFERFERGEAARGYGGLGLGLWIARELVTALGGAIDVDSAPGAGAAFRIELPMEAPTAHSG